MDDKLKKLADLKAQRQKIDDEITKVKAEVQAEMDAIMKTGKTRKKRVNAQKQLSLQP